jgi:hypothetical protein
VTDFTGVKRTEMAFGKYKFSKRLGRFGLREEGGTVESILRKQTAGVR